MIARAPAPGIQTMELYDGPIGLLTLLDDIRDRATNATEHSPEGRVRLRVTVQSVQKEVENVTAEEVRAALEELESLEDDVRYDSRIVGAVGGKEPPLLSIYESHGDLHEGQGLKAYQRVKKTRAKELLMRMYRDRQLSFVGLGSDNGKWKSQSVFGGFDLPGLRKNQEAPGEISITMTSSVFFDKNTEGDLWLLPTQPNLSLAMMAEPDIAAEMGDDYADRQHNTAIIMPHGVTPGDKIKSTF